MNQETSTTIQITVFGHHDAEICLISGCGSEVRSAEAAEELRTALASLLGNRIAVRHYDLAQPNLAHRFADVIQGARARNLPFPLVAINGDIVLAGPIDLEAVLRKLNEFIS